MHKYYFEWLSSFQRKKISIVATYFRRQAFNYHFLELTFWGHEIIKRVCPFLSLFRWRSYRGAVDCTFRVPSFQKTESEFHVCSSAKIQKKYSKISLILFTPIYFLIKNCNSRTRTMSLPTFLLLCLLNCHTIKTKCISLSLTHFLPVFFGSLSPIIFMPWQNKLSWFACLHFSSPNSAQLANYQPCLVYFFMQCQVNKLCTQKIAHMQLTR